MTRLSPRARITLGSLAVAAILLVVALLVVRWQVAEILADADASLARSDLTSFDKDITAHPDEPVDDPGTGVLVHITDPSGTVQVNTLPHDVDEVVAGRGPGNEQFTMTDDEGRTYVVVAQTVTTDAGTWELWSARSTSASELALEGLDRVLLVGGLLLLAGFAIASFTIATLALRPVEAARAREKQMVSDAAHELRTPLAALRTQLELAHHDFGNAEALAGQVRSAEASVGRLTSLAANLLELSRLESHESGPGSATMAQLASEFAGSVDRARMLGLDRSVRVDFEVADPEPDARVRIDAQAFGRLADNLFSNAIAAVDRGGSVTGVLAQGGGRVTLTVTDDGPGMPDDFIPQAFERFTRPDTSRSSATGGSGLGLALVAALAREAGGEVSAVNTHPGLRVTVGLPSM